MSINLDPEFFKIVEDDERKFRLIIPSHSAACANTIWTNQNKWYRSRVETFDGQTVSSGFGKFLNLGQENQDIGVSANDILTEIRNGKRVVATLKYDGSCLIRSVYKGEVIFRTRGSLSYGFHDQAENEMGIFLDKYPRLMDPTWQTTRSLLFEWITPAFQIVIPYKEVALVLIGAVDHGHRHISHLRYLTMEELAPIAVEGGMALTEHYTLNSVKDWYNFYYEVLAHKDIEGYVLRIHNEQTLVKIKSEPYLTKHGIKSNLCFKSMVEFWLLHGKETVYQSILGQLEKLYDEEVVMWALPFIDNLFTAVEKWERVKAQLYKLVDEHSHLSRKDFAIYAQEVYAKDKLLFSIAMQIWQGKPIEDRSIQSFMYRFDINV